MVLCTPSKYVRASEHTPVEVAVAEADAVRETDGARDALILTLAERESVWSVDEVRDALRLVLSLPDTLRLALTDRESVGSTDGLPDTLRDIEVDSVSEAVKLGETGDLVTDGVIDGDGIITV